MPKMPKGGSKSTSIKTTMKPVFGKRVAGKRGGSR